MSKISPEARERIEQLARDRWNRMVQRDEQQVVRDVVAEATEVAKTAARGR